MTANTTRKTMKSTFAMSSAPAATPVNPSSPAMPASTRNKKAHFSRDIMAPHYNVKAIHFVVAPKGNHDRFLGRSITRREIEQMECHF